MDMKKLSLSFLLVAIILPAGILFFASTTSASTVITDIRITGASGSTTMTVGQSQQLTAIDQNNEDVTSSISWSSSNVGILTVSGDGLVRAVGAGQATITGASAWITRNIIFTVNASATQNTTAVITSIRITGASGSTTMTVGQTQQLTAIDQNNENITSIVSWSSSDTGVLTVNGSGFVAAAGVGRAQITASSALITRNIIFTVNAASNNSGNNTGSTICSTAEDCNGGCVCPSGEKCNASTGYCEAGGSASGTGTADKPKGGSKATLINPLGRIDTFPELLTKIAGEVGKLITYLGTIMLIVAGILYLTSAGNPERMGKAKTALVYAIAGIVVGLAASTIVNIIKDVIGVK